MRENDRNTHELIKIKGKKEKIDLYANQVYEVMPSFNKYDDEKIWKYKLFLVDNFVKSVSILQVRNRVRSRIDSIRERIRKVNGNIQYMINDDNNVFIYLFIYFYIEYCIFNRYNFKFKYSRSSKRFISTSNSSVQFKY